MMATSKRTRWWDVVLSSLNFWDEAWWEGGVGPGGKVKGFQKQDTLWKVDLAISI